jgi:hypothetical protein
MKRHLVALGVLGTIGCSVPNENSERSSRRTVPTVDPSPGPGATGMISTGAEPSGPIKETVLVTPEGELPVKYQLVGSEPVFEGDILLPTEGSEVRSAVVVGQRWPDAVVPYVVDANLPLPERVHFAIAQWEHQTKLRFVPRTTQSDYVHFRSGNDCSSKIGRVGGRQYVNLNTGEDASTVQAIGIDHSTTPETFYYFYKRGFATGGSATSVSGRGNHFRYALARGKATTNLVDVAFGRDGHVFAYYDDLTVSEGTREDLASFAPPKRYTLALGKAAVDVTGIAVDDTGKSYTYYRDGTTSTGDVFDLARDGAPSSFAPAEGKRPAQLAHVDIDRRGQLYAFYTELGGAPPAMTVSIGSARQLASVSPPMNVAFQRHCTGGITIHEIGHAVGLYHEQTRHDRDDHVKVLWENIDPSKRHNFEKRSRAVGADVGPYDFGSVMHYGSMLWSQNGRPTMTKLDGSTFEDQRERLSPTDVQGVRSLYP